MVIEDSCNGLLAAKAANFNCLITTNGYSADEDFTEADILVNELGDDPDIQITMDDLILYIKNKNN